MYYSGVVMDNRCWTTKFGPLLALVCGCGPSGPSATSHGQAESGEEPSSDTSQSGESTTESGADCTESDLPQPFCHRLLLYSAGIGEPVGFLDEIRNGSRPLLMTGREDFGLRLVDSLDASEILAEVPPPLDLDWRLSGNLGVRSGDFDGDGSLEFVIFVDLPQGRMVATLDGETLETRAFRDFGVDSDYFSLQVEVADLDDNGIDEIVTGQTGDLGLRVGVWSADQGEIALVRENVAPEYRCSYWNFVRGDYDGSGQSDLSIVWHKECAEFPVTEPPPILTLMSSQNYDSELTIGQSLQPESMRRAASGDFDGDGKTELIVAESPSKMTVLDWQDDTFVEMDVLQPSSVGMSDLFSVLRGGRYSHLDRAGVLVSPIPRDGETLAGDEFFTGALLPASSDAKVVEIPTKIVQVGTTDFDVNGDEILDFMTVDEGRFGIYISRP